MPLSKNKRVPASKNQSGHVKSMCVGSLVASSTWSRIRQSGCRKWGCNKGGGLKRCLAALRGKRPKSALFTLCLPFSPFSGRPEQHLENQRTQGKGRFKWISSSFLGPPSLIRLLNPCQQHSKTRSVGQEATEILSENHRWATPPVRLGISGRNSRKIPERPRKRSQSVSWNSPREYGWDAPNPIIQGI